MEAALRARENAHAPYSDFAVGAAALDEDLRLHRGCNIESASYGLTICAERVALFSAVADGAAEIKAMAVVGPGYRDRPTPPCGACRQVIWDLAGDITLLLATTGRQVEIWRAGELLPSAFDSEHLNQFNDEDS